ncbi:SDR family NAD(P)-dependent oxidoreductase [Marinobacter subterrani]|uniref:Short chain dehydrogenase n=1 Tax=Marinobacter subterrani TaxID=1658765 RepID=A0A0J7JDM4_9GAMM|nr:SDR family NAD(P)-dependent oxidoreductase [Marinobacter subterrani]KMQ75916.1 short chain dehydrogenase [Marinobacter subterrani]
MSAQTVWITGASSGIGEALALQFAQNGDRLVLSARREGELERVAVRCRDTGLPTDQVLVLPLDVTDWDSLPGKVQAVLDRFGSIDLLVNNAGVSQRSLCKDTDMSVYQKLMDVDVMGQIALAGDGSAFGKEDEDIAGGMDVNECAEVVFKGLKARKREIPVGKGKEMAALWIKRISPEALFRMARARH